MTRTTLRRRGQLTLPAEVRAALRIEEGDEVEFELTETGEVVMRGLKMIPAEQAWFWTSEWQGKEREADEDLSAGRTQVYASPEDMFDDLDR